MFGKNARKDDLIELAKALNLKMQEMKKELSMLKYLKEALINHSDEIQSLKNDITNLKKIAFTKTAIETENFIDTSLPDIPWIKEIISKPNSEKFKCLPEKQKMKIWKTIFDNIGFTSEFDIIGQYPFHLGEEYFQEIDMKMIGLIFLGQLGNGYGEAKQCNYVFNFSDFKINSDEYKSVINRVISMGVEDFEMHDYKDTYSPGNNEHEIIFGYDAAEIKLKIEGGKYLDGSLIEKVVREIVAEIDPTRFYFWLHCELGSYLLCLNNYQKDLIERLFHIPNGLKILNVAKEN
jgi:hypothetical protein